MHSEISQATCDSCGNVMPVDWVGDSVEPETCTDPNCKCWEPGEYESIVLGIKPEIRLKWSVSIEWKPEDCWVGVFWRKPRFGHSVDIWICIIPMLPIHIKRRAS